MSRPLLITDCDEVLLHFVRHFTDWLDTEHGIAFRPVGGHFANAARRKSDGELVSTEQLFEWLGDFFDAEMARQTIVPYAREALARIAEVADIVILTNLADHRLDGRVGQLKALGIEHRVICNGFGPKGAGVAALVEEYAPSVTIFVDDLAWHHTAVAEAVPEVLRLHMVAEPTIAGEVTPAEHAHARIDDWADALPWILGHFDAEA